jgi:hypothetical protein
MNPRVLVPLLAFATLLPAIPTAAAGPDCIQAVPWSYLCDGDVDKFVKHYTSAVDPDPQVCLLDRDCFDPGWYCLHGADVLCPQPTSGPECLQVYPWSMLCSGDLGGFVDHFVGDLVAFEDPGHDSTCDYTRVCVVDCPTDPNVDRNCIIHVPPIVHLP